MPSWILYQSQISSYITSVFHWNQILTTLIYGIKYEVDNKRVVISSIYFTTLQITIQYIIISVYLLTHADYPFHILVISVFFKKIPVRNIFNSTSQGSF